MRVMKARIGDNVEIRWYGPLPPKVSDVIVTTTGRRYVVVASNLNVQARRRASVKLTCVVVPRDYPAPPGAAVRSMRWLKRKPAVLR